MLGTGFTNTYICQNLVRTSSHIAIAHLYSICQVSGAVGSSAKQKENKDVRTDKVPNHVEKTPLLGDSMLLAKFVHRAIR